MKKTILFRLTLLTLALCLFGCGSNHDEPTPPPAPADTLPDAKDIADGGTVLVYMIATNNLGQSGWDERDIDEMVSGMRSLRTAHPARLLVYHADAGKTPVMREIAPGGKSTELRTYTDGAPSVSIARMREVIADASASDEMPLRGIIFWSHGSGWIEEDRYTYDDPDAPDLPDAPLSPLSFGIDTGGLRMSVPSLGAALDGCSLRFIYFDCCLMGTVEVAYELRHAAEKIVGVSTELPLEGMPYDRNMAHFFSGRADALEKAARTTYDYYCSDLASNNSIAIGVCRASQLDALADESRRVMLTGSLIDAAYRGIRLYRPEVTPMGSFDMADFYAALGATTAWRTAYAAAVTYAAATPKSYWLDMTGYSGLGSAIFSSASDPRIGYGYRRLQWWTDVVSLHPVFADAQ